MKVFWSRRYKLDSIPVLVIADLFIYYFFLSSYLKLQEQATLLQQMQAAAVAAASGDAGKAQAKLSPHQQQLHSLALQQAHMIQLQAQQQAVASGQMMLPPRLQQGTSS